jgi:hypothetical protein
MQHKEGNKMEKIVKTAATTAILLVLLFVVNVSAVSIGVSPGHTDINFEPNLERDFTINIHNLGDEPFVADTYISARTKVSEGWVTIKEKSLTIAPHSSEPVHITIKLSESIPIGKHRVDVAARARPPESGAAVGVTAGVIHQIYVINPATGKDINLVSLSVNDVIKGEEARFTLGIESFGKEGSVARGYIKIFDEYGTHITTLITDKKTVAAIENAELTATWDTSLAEAGDYVAVGHVEYDGKKTNELSKHFSVLGPYGRIIKFEVYTSEKADFVITFKNYFTRDVDCKAKVVIKDLKGGVVGSVEGDRHSAPALGTKILHLYWTPKEGEYIAEATVSYGGKTTDAVEERFNIEKKALGLTAPKELVLVLVIIPIIVAVVVLRKKKK